MTTLYSKIRSWHIVVSGKTRCGKPIDVFAAVETEIPWDEKSCESCLRLARRDEDEPLPVNEDVGE